MIQNYGKYFYTVRNDFLMHYGIKGQKWGIRRYQNPDGTLTAEGKERYKFGDNGYEKSGLSGYKKSALIMGGEKYNKEKIKKVADNIKSSQGFINLMNDFKESIDKSKDIMEYDSVVLQTTKIIKKMTNDSLDELYDKKVTDLSMNPLQLALTAGGYISFSSKSYNFGDAVTNELYKEFNELRGA